MAEIPTGVEILKKLGFQFSRAKNRLHRFEGKRHVTEGNVTAFEYAARPAAKHLRDQGDCTTIGQVYDAIVKLKSDEQSRQAPDVDVIKELNRVLHGLVPAAVRGNAAYLELTVDQAQEKLEELAVIYNGDMQKTDEFYHVPLDGVCEWFEERTGISWEEFREAALQGFGGRQEIVIKLKELDAEGSTSNLWSKLIKEFPDILRWWREKGVTKQANAESDQGVAKHSASDADDLEPVAKLIPAYDEDSDDWILGKAAARFLDVRTETLANRRSLGKKATKGEYTYGRHDGDCFWCKRGTRHPRYYLPRLKNKAAGQLVETVTGARLDF